jgi:polymerase delta-interacting protein 3
LSIFRLGGSGKPGLKKTPTKPVPGGRKGGLGSPLKKSTGSLLDARSKIIQKKRTKIRDAREIITESSRSHIKDARQLISSPKKKPAASNQQRSQKKAISQRGTLRLSTLARNLKPTVVSDDDDDDFDMDGLHLKPVASLKRTVRNDMFRTVPPMTMPKLPHFSINQELTRLSPDPFDCYVVPTRRPIPVPPTRPERADRYQPGRIMSAHMDAYEPRKSILRSAPADDHDDRFDDDRYFSSSSAVRSRLYNDSHDRNESAGIFAKLPVRGSSPPTAQVGHRIIISNLHKSVTESDVRELFEDIGSLFSAKLVRPGIAEVVYKNLGEAEEAVEAYHNRQLDGQAMKCMLVRSSGKPSYSRL